MLDAVLGADPLHRGKEAETKFIEPSDCEPAELLDEQAFDLSRPPAPPLDEQASAR